MNLTTTNNTVETLDMDIIKYGTVADIVLATSEAHTKNGRAAKEAAVAFNDNNTTNLIGITTDMIQNEHGVDKAAEYIAKAQPIVQDPLGLLETKKKTLIQITQKSEVIDTTVVDDERVAKLEEEKKALEAKISDQYTSAVASEAVLKSNLDRAEKVIKKLEEGGEITAALKDAEKLREKLSVAQTAASSVGSLKEQLSQSREAIQNAKTYANGLKMQIARASDDAIEQKKKLDNIKGEAMLSAEEKETIKHHAGVAALRKMKEEYSLEAYMLDNGMTEDEYKEALVTIDAKHYDTQDVEEIANVIVTTDNCETAISKISGIIGVAIRRAEQAELKSRFSSMKFNYNETMQKLIAERI